MPDAIGPMPSPGGDARPQEALTLQRPDQAPDQGRTISRSADFAKTAGRQMARPAARTGAR